MKEEWADNCIKAMKQSELPARFLFKAVQSLITGVEPAEELIITVPAVGCTWSKETALTLSLLLLNFSALLIVAERISQFNASCQLTQHSPPEAPASSLVCNRYRLGSCLVKTAKAIASRMTSVLFAVKPDVP